MNGAQALIESLKREGTDHIFGYAGATICPAADALKDAAEIGYTYKFMRVYISGTNLLTFAPFKYWDPEKGSGNGLSYPLQRTCNLGFQFNF